MIRKSMPSGYDPTGVQRFSEKIMLNQKPRYKNPIEIHGNIATIINPTRSANR
jgi:hypothetical protein